VGYQRDFVSLSRLQYRMPNNEIANSVKIKKDKNSAVFLEISFAYAVGCNFGFGFFTNLGTYALITIFLHPDIRKILSKVWKSAWHALIIMVN